VPYNEGWGQWDTARIVELVRKLDATRPVNNASGWTDRGVGDVNDLHKYPGPGSPEPEANRAVVLGEFGGLGLPIRGHTWQSEKNWGYRSFTDSETLTDAYIDLVEKLFPLIDEKGLSAAVYTQTTDVEIEVNGLLTYDRAVFKMEEGKLRAAHEKLYLPPVIEKVILPNAQQGKFDWKYTFEKPDGSWMAPDYDDSSWQTGPGGFGTPTTPNSIVQTVWDTPNIWLRRTFTLEEVPDEAIFLLFHDEDAEIYLNGIPAAALEGYSGKYIRTPLLNPAQKALKKGQNCIAISCRQTTGGQYIDAGLIQLEEQK
jgi:hypothetical protein